jgi:hypothetical protein
VAGKCVLDVRQSVQTTNSRYRSSINWMVYTVRGSRSSLSCSKASARSKDKTPWKLTILIFLARAKT